MTMSAPSSRDKKTSPLALVVLLSLGGADWLVLNLVVAPQVFAPTSSHLASSIAPATVPPAAVSVARLTHAPSGTRPTAPAQPDLAPPPPASSIPPAVVPAASASSPIPAVQAPSASAPSEVPAAEERIPHLHFDGMSAFLDADARNTLCTVARRMKEDPNLRIKIVGHTDSRGESDLNMRLSKRRAESASTFLMVVLGIDAARIETTASGATTPLETTNTWDANRKNRRVEMFWQ